MRSRHFTDIADLDRPELLGLLNSAQTIGRKRKAGRQQEIGAILARQAVAFVSTKQSLRTGGSIDVAVDLLGGHVKDFMGNSLVDELGKPREPLADIAGCLEAIGYPIIFARLHSHRQLMEMMQATETASVVNALTDESHPLQALADAEALMLAKPDVSKKKVVFVGDGNNVATSLGEICALLGWDYVHSGPEERQIRPKRFWEIVKLSSGHGGTVRYVPDPKEAVPDATMVYTDVHASMGDKGNAEKLKELLAPYRVTEALMGRAGPQAVFGHCLPVERGCEVDSAVIDGPQSIVKMIAGCRTDTAAALIQLLLSHRR